MKKFSLTNKSGLVSASDVGGEVGLVKSKGVSIGFSSGVAKDHWSVSLGSESSKTESPKDKSSKIKIHLLKNKPLKKSG